MENGAGGIAGASGGVGSPAEEPLPGIMPLPCVAPVRPAAAAPLCMGGVETFDPALPAGVVAVVPCCWAGVVCVWPFLGPSRYSTAGVSVSIVSGVEKLGLAPPLSILGLTPGAGSVDGVPGAVAGFCGWFCAAGGGTVFCRMMLGPFWLSRYSTTVLSGVAG